MTEVLEVANFKLKHGVLAVSDAELGLRVRCNVSEWVGLNLFYGVAVVVAKRFVVVDLNHTRVVYRATVKLHFYLLRLAKIQVEARIVAWNRIEIVGRVRMFAPSVEGGLRDVYEALLVELS